jgi:hypothetical protein
MNSKKRGGGGGGYTCILGPFHVLALLEGDVEFLVGDEELGKDKFVRTYTAQFPFNILQGDDEFEIVPRFRL